MPVSYDNLDNQVKSLINGVGLVGEADKFYVVKDGGQSKTYWDGRVPSDRIYFNPSSGAGTALTQAHSAMTSGRNDVAILSPDSHSIGATLTWSKNMCHLLGAYGPAMMNQRARIGASTTITPMVDITGYGNTFANLYNMWGYANTGSTMGVRITGNRNSFNRVHFAGPQSTTIATALSSACNIYGAEECYFNNCTFGTDIIERPADILSLQFSGAGGSDVAMRHVFENCLFLAGSDSGLDAHFIHATAATHGWALFKNCTFINIAAGGFGSNTMALALSSANGSDFRFLFDTNCSFHGVTDIIAHGDEAKVEFATVTAVNTSVTATIGTGLPLNPDTTA